MTLSSLRVSCGRHGDGLSFRPEATSVFKMQRPGNATSRSLAAVPDILVIAGAGERRRPAWLLVNSWRPVEFAEECAS